MTFSMYLLPSSHTFQTPVNTVRVESSGMIIPTEYMGKQSHPRKVKQPKVNQEEPQTTQKRLNSGPAFFPSAWVTQASFTSEQFVRSSGTQSPHRDDGCTLQMVQPLLGRSWAFLQSLSGLYKECAFPNSHVNHGC